MAQNYQQPGKILTLQANQVVCPLGSAGQPQSGDPVVQGSIVGVSDSTTVNPTDLFPCMTVGVFALSVKGANNSGNVAVALGDKLYISATAVATMISKDPTGIYFGTALATVASGATTTINVRLASSF